MRLFRIRLLTLLSLLGITPLGFFSKLYSGPAERWVNHYAGDLLYEIFWCMLIFCLLPKRKAIPLIPTWVFGITCLLEILQLWRSPVLTSIRATFIGRTLIGTTFSGWDFLYYAVGSIFGWLWLRLIWELSINTRSANNSFERE